MLGHGEDVEGTQHGQVPAIVEKDPHVTSERGRVARHVDQRAHGLREAGEGPHDAGARTLARRIEHDDVRPAEA